MTISLKCKCGENYQTDERHLGFSIKCRTCHRVIPIEKTELRSYTYNQKSDTSYSPPKTIFEDVSVEPKSPFFGNIVIPLAGVLALLVGIILTVTNLRQQNNSQPMNTVLAQSSTPIQIPIPPSNTANTIPLDKSQKNPRLSNKSVVQAPSQQQYSNEEQQSNAQSETSPTPTSSPVTVRYDTGKNLIAPQNTGGRGTLEISNGTGTDAIAKLVDAETNKTLRLVYIQANSNFTVKNIKVGNYILKFSLGSGYILETGKFQYSPSFSRFDETLDFVEYREGNRIVWSTFSVTLNKVIYGNAQTTSISESDFEDK